MINSPTLRIVRTSLFIFFCYLIVGGLLATVPGYMHLNLGFTTFLAGVAVSAQYVATLLSRPKVGRMTDVLGPRTVVLLGQLACFLSGLLLLLAVTLEDKAIFCFAPIVPSARPSPSTKTSFVVAGFVVSNFSRCRACRRRAQRMRFCPGLSSPWSRSRQSGHRERSWIRAGRLYRLPGSCAGHHRPRRRIHHWELGLSSYFSLWFGRLGRRLYPHVKYSKV